MTRWSAASLALACLSWAVPTAAEACGEVAWTDIEGEIAFREDCFRTPAGDVVDYIAVRFNPSQVRLGLVGGLPDASVPSAKTLEVVEGKNNLLPMEQVFLKVGSARVLLPVGDVIAEEYRLPGALVRQDGTDLAERNNIWSGASAFFCLNDRSQNEEDVGSAFVMFNAFERGKPVEMNKRVADGSNCPDVIQVGPRVVEYREKPGIPSSEARLEKNRLRYAILAQGSGRKYDGYILINKDPTNLYYLQEFLLGRGAVSADDRSVRMAVNLIAGDPVSLIAGIGDNIVRSVGAVDQLTWPVYLAVEPIP